VIIFLEDGKLAWPMSVVLISSSKMALDTWWLHHGGSTFCDHMVSPKGLLYGTETFYMQPTGSKYQSVIVIKDWEIGVTAIWVSHLFRSAGSKHSQYLRIQPSEHAGFPYAGWEREGKGMGNLPFKRKNHSLKVTPGSPSCRSFQTVLP
jgi:hypothetical protein